MKRWKLVLYSTLICLPAVLVTGVGLFFGLSWAPRIIRNEPRRVTMLYREEAERLKAQAKSVKPSLKRPVGPANGKIDGQPWGYSVKDGQASVWIQSLAADGKKEWRQQSAEVHEEMPYAWIFYGGGGMVLLVLVGLTAFAVWYFVRFVKERDDFLAATAHDLTTPLVGMRLVIGRNDAEAKNLNERMIRLVQNLKDFLKLGGRPTPKAETFDLIAAYREAYALFAADYRDLFEGEDVAVTVVRREGAPETGMVRREGAPETGMVRREGAPGTGMVRREGAPETGVARREGAPETMMVVADETLTVQILWNLLGNDLKYAAPYGRVSVRFGRTGKYVTCEFVDKGQGMTPTEMRRAFDRYYRAKTVLEAGKGGFGIGLCTAKEFAQAMGGELNVRANEPKGCIFTLYLPSAI